MGLYALVSAGGSPGVTTSALALALGWPSQVIVAECDPSGGDILAGLFAGHLPGRTGLLPLAMEAGRSADAAAGALWHQLIELDDERSRLLLAGISDPRQAAGIAPSWPAVAAALAAVPADVLADCGRVDAAPATAPVLMAASLVTLVLRPSLRQVSKAKQRIELLTDILGGAGRLVVLLIGEGTHSAGEIAKALGVPVAASLPQDEKTARVLSDGEGRRRSLAARPLVRSGGVAGRALRDAALAARQRPGALPPSGQFSGGQFATGQFAAGQPANGQFAAGQFATGFLADGQVVDGQPAQGQFAPGQLTDGLLFDGPPSQGRFWSADGQFAPGQGAGGQFAPGQPADGQFTSGPPANGQPAERRPADGNAAARPGEPESPPGPGAGAGQ
jgi:hypothetical protein